MAQPNLKRLTRPRLNAAAVEAGVKAPENLPNKAAVLGAIAAAEASQLNLYTLGARVVSVFGPWSSRVLIDMPVRTAEPLFPKGLGAAARTSLVEAVVKDVEAIRDVAPELADSALAANAIALAYEIEHPYNSATSKSMCSRSLMDVLDRLRELAPDPEDKDKLDELSAKRAARLAERGAAAKDQRST